MRNFNTNTGMQEIATKTQRLKETKRVKLYFVSGSNSKCSIGPYLPTVRKPHQYLYPCFGAVSHLHAPSTNDS